MLYIILGFFIIFVLLHVIKLQTNSFEPFYILFLFDAFNIGPSFVLIFNVLLLDI